MSAENPHAAAPLAVVIEDDAAAADPLRLVLLDWGAEVLHGADGEALLAAARARGAPVRWIIVDRADGDESRLAQLKRLRTRAPRARVLVLSGAFAGGATNAAARAGFDVMHKPAHAESIVQWLERG